MASADDVAALIMKLLGGADTFKLQKLVYYSQAWHLVWEDKPLFDEPIEAWAAGPVVRSLYEHHRGRYSMPADEWQWGDQARLDDEEQQTVLAVLDSYGRLSGRSLSQLTHNEQPWSKAREGLGPTDASSHVIALADMKEYYSSLDSAGEDFVVSVAALLATE